MISDHQMNLADGGIKQNNKGEKMQAGCLRTHITLE
jgi:hypothetical protein